MCQIGSRSRFLSMPLAKRSAPWQNSSAVCAGLWGCSLVSHAAALRDDKITRKPLSASGPNATPTLGAQRERLPQIDPLLHQASLGLRAFQLLLRTTRLYNSSHP